MLSVRHLLIIGGTKGLGKAFCSAMSSTPCRITVIARSLPASTGSTGNVNYITADVTVAASLKAALEQAVARDGKFHQVAFFQQDRAKDNSWERKLACTLTATHTALEVLQHHFAAEGDKAVVLLTSIASRFVADEQDVGYHAAKTGLLGLGRYYAFKLGTLGVRVNFVTPGTVLKDEAREFYSKNPGLRELLQQTIPLRRMGTAAEVTAAVKFLLSPEASFITGQELVVDGGAGLQSQESLARALANNNVATRSRQ